MDLSAFFEKEIVCHRPFPACHFLATDAPKANSRSKSSHMKKLNHTEIQFLELYKSSLWGTPLKDDLFASEATDWSRIVEIAKQQTAIACTADALSHLPKDLVPHDLRLQLIGSVLSVQRANEAMNRLLPQLFSLLKAEGIRTWLLKGQGLACHYPAPELRQSGDIDLFFPNLQQFYQAYDLFSQTFRRTEELQPDSLHAAFEYQNIVIELHGKIVLRINRKLDKNFNGWLHNRNSRWTDSNSSGLLRCHLYPDTYRTTLFRGRYRPSASERLDAIPFRKKRRDRPFRIGKRHRKTRIRQDLARLCRNGGRAVGLPRRSDASVPERKIHGRKPESTAVYPRLR